jgi:uncharacterized protein YkwD
MRRPTFRRSLRLETLESRELLTAGGPSAEAQAMLSMINLSRTNPSEAAQLFTQNLDPNVQATVKYYGVDVNQVAKTIASSPTRPPLAWNDQLTSAAIGHSQDMANNGFQSHSGSDGSSSGQRLDSAGYTNRSSDGENAYAYATSVTEAMEAFLIDWGVSDNGHRNNLLQPNASSDQLYREVGIGIESSNKAGFGPEVITQDFGSRSGAKADVVGVVYNDPSHTHLYSQGSGVGNVQVQALNVNTGATTSIQSWDAGGYQMALDPGTYKITAIDNGQVVQTEQINISNQNVEVDFDLSDPWQGGTIPTAPAPSSSQQTLAMNAPSQSQNQSVITPAWPSSGNGAGRPWFSGWSSWFARTSS